MTRNSKLTVARFFFVFTLFFGPAVMVVSGASQSALGSWVSSPKPS
jgi:hypothetical protein